MATQKPGEVDWNLLVKKASSPGVVTKIRRGVRSSLRFYLGQDREVAEARDIDEFGLLTFYQDVVKNGLWCRSIGKKSFQAVHDYLSEKGLIAVDYRFAHLPVFKAAPRDMEKGTELPVAEIAQIEFKLSEESSKRQLVYVAGVFIGRRNNRRNQLVAQLESFGGPNERFIVNPKGTLISRIENYRPL